MDSSSRVPVPENEPVLGYRPGSSEREELEAALTAIASHVVDLPQVIGGEFELGSGDEVLVVQPHSHAEPLGRLHSATHADAERAIDAALRAAPTWRDLAFEERAAIFLKAADLAAGPWRARLNAATMLGQSKTVHQAEIDAACELIDFWRFNVSFGAELLGVQPISSRGVWNRADYRPLEGFVYAVSPFNFTAIAGNLPTAPALMGNTVVWKPATTQQRAASVVMELLVEAGLPPGVINMVTGGASAVSEVAVGHPSLAGIHFTGSTPVFQSLWSAVGERIPTFRTYPRLVGETGGKDFVVAHPSADIDVLHALLVRGAFEYQGQKCSAASRAYVPESLWHGQLREQLAATVDSLPVGDVRDFSNFMGAVIDGRSFDKLATVIDRSRVDSSVQIVAGGSYDKSVGFFVRPTVLTVSDPSHAHLRDEYFGPILAVHVYKDSEYDDMLTQMESVAPYALTGSIVASDRAVIARSLRELRFAAGNVYINDKPTGAVVGQQPFGGGRASGTNDKAGSQMNLARWVSPRVIKESFDPPLTWAYPHMEI